MQMPRHIESLFKCPLYLEFCDEVDVTLAGQLLSDPLLKYFGEALVDLQPRRVETQAQRSSILIVMPETNVVSPIIQTRTQMWEVN